MLEIYKTNVKTKTQSKRVLEYLQKKFSGVTVNFDLSDRDRILRVNGIEESDISKVVSHLNQLGHTCEILSC